MKKIITILAALLVVCAFVCIAAYAFRNEPDGFGGITWGTNITEMKEKLVYLYTDPRYGGIQIYKIKRSWLQTLRSYKVWGERVKSIEYGFWRGKFSEVIIKTKGTASFAQLKNLCFEKFGQGHQEGNRERYTWSGKITLMRLEYREFSKEGILSLASTKIRQLQEAFAEQMATCVTWAKTYGGIGSEAIPSIELTSDGGYIVAGITDSFGAGGDDVWVVKLDAGGCIEWEKTYGDTDLDVLRSIQQTEDNGYIVAGYTLSVGAGGGDVWVLKLDASGEVEWQKTYGGNSIDYARSIQQTEDHGYIVAGFTLSFGAGQRDLWVLKLDENGNIQWEKTYGVSDYYEGAHVIQQTRDGGYIVAGTYEGIWTFIEPISTWMSVGHFWVLKLDENGTILWQKTYGGISTDLEQPSIQQTLDGGYIVAGRTGSFGPGQGDLWVLKLYENGTIQWQMSYGDTGGEGATSIQQTEDTGYIVTGSTDSFGGGRGDMWVLKLDADGAIQLQKTYGDIGADGARSIQQTTDYGYIVTGLTSSYGAGGSDFWVLKLDVGGNISDTCPPNIGQDTTVIPVNTTAVPVDTQATVSDTSCTVNATSVTPQDTNAIVETQCIDMTWAKTYGISGYWDSAFSIHQTQDGGYIVTGQSSGGDSLVLKLDGSGCIVWQKTYGVAGAFSNQKTDDGGYVVAGNTKSYRNGSYDFDFLVLKLDGSGDIEWKKTYGGEGGNEHGRSIQQTQDGGYIVAGETRSFGAGGYDFWVLKLNENGTIQWEKTYGGTSFDEAYSIQQTEDGGYIVAGDSHSFGTAGYIDVWVLKLDGDGDIQWEKTYGGSNVEYAYSIIEDTINGGYIVAGVTHSFGAGMGDIWVLKLDADGNIVWQKTYGGPADEQLTFSIQQTDDRGYIVAGCTESFGAGIHDIWVLKLDSGGNIAWQKTYGGTDSDVARSMQQTQDGGYIVAGETRSFGAGHYDVWVLKLDAEGNISDTCPPGIGQDTSVVPANTSVVPADTQATVTDTSCTVTSPSVTPQDTSVIVETQCQN